MTTHVFKHTDFAVQNATPDTTTFGGWTMTELWADTTQSGDPLTNNSDKNYVNGRHSGGDSVEPSWPYASPSWRSNAPIRVALTEIPVGQTITSATLYMYKTFASGAGNHDIALRRLLVPFVETEATWNIRSTGTDWTGTLNGADRGGLSNVAEGNVASTAVNDTTPVWVSWDVTSYVQGVYAGTFDNHGLLLIRDIGASPNDGSTRRFRSRAYSVSPGIQQPELIVVYEDAAPAGPVITDGEFTAATTEGFQVRFTTNTANGTAYYVVEPTGGPDPTALQISNGQNDEGTAALRAGEQAVSTTGVQTFATAVTGLDPNTTYRVSVVHLGNP